MVILTRMLGSYPKFWAPAKRAGIALIVCAAVIPCAGQTSTPEGRYIVNATPIDIGIRGPRNFCVAVDPNDREGVWWWEAGATGCNSRSTGPAVFHPDGASVVKSNGIIDVRFRIQLITGPGFAGDPYKEVALVIRDGRLSVSATGDDVATTRRKDLELPERVR